jgi:hypothetical protein
MAIYESAVSRESSLSSSSSSLLAKVMDFMLGGPMLRMLYGAATVTMMSPISVIRTADPPYARLMPLRNNNDHHRKAISFWVCFVVVALAYSKRNISVDVWQSILKRPTTPTKNNKKHRNSSINSSDESFQETIEAVYALCRKLVRYAVDALEKARQQRNSGGGEEQTQQQDEHDDLSPAQHRGSCHCGAVKFVVFGAKTLYVESTTSTTSTSTDPQCRRILPYEYARINNTSLTWDEGHVQSYDSRYFFCPSCGVHLAHAVTTSSTGNNNAAADEIQLFINVDCLDGSSYILRPVSSRPPEATTTDSFVGRRPLDVPLTIPVPVVADQRHHATLVSECASTIAGTQQRQRHSPSSPSVSALDDDLEFMSTTADNNDVRSINLLGTTTATTSASVASGQTTEELAVTAYRLRKALLSHTAASSTTTATATKTSLSVSPRVAAATTAAPTSPALVDYSQTECDDDDDNKNNDDDDDDNPNSQPDAASSPTRHESSRSPKASVPIYHRGEPAAAAEQESSSITSDAEKLRRYLGKHNGGG